MLMKKLMLVCVAVALASAVVAGCRAEGAIDPDGKVSYNRPLSR